MQPIFLKTNLATESTLKGVISGVAYSGAVVPQHGFWTNLIVDLDTLRIEREGMPLLRDHMPSQVAGFASARIENNQVLIDGKISSKTSHGQEIMALAEDGFGWQLSLGIYEGEIEEVVNAVVNGIELESATVLRNGLLRENSVVAIGADMNTNSTILSQQMGDTKLMEIKMSKKAYAALACACGGHADDTPEELEKKASEKAKLAKEEQEKDIAAKQVEIDELKKQIADKQAEIDAIKAEEESEERTEKIEQAVKEKGIKFSAEKIAEAAKSKEKTEVLLSVIADMEAVAPGKKIDPKFTGKANLGAAEKEVGDDTNAIRLEAERMVKDKEATDMIDAFAKIQKKGSK